VKALFVAVGLFAASVAPAQTVLHTADVPRLVKELEQAPLSPDARKKRADLLEWATATKDVSVTVCDVLGPVPSASVPHGPELLFQAMLGNGAFQLKYPEHKGNELRAQLAGIESMLLTYEKLLAADVKARIPEYDRWLVNLKAGSLEAELGSAIKAKCAGHTPKA
jgi:hypothetical protein